MEMPSSKAVSTGRSADLGVWGRKEQGRFDALHFGQIEFQRLRGRGTEGISRPEVAECPWQ